MVYVDKERHPLMTDLEKLRAFAQFVLEKWPSVEDWPDEFDIENKAVEFGLIEKHWAKEPCCEENCQCKKYPRYGEFPQMCYRRTKTLTGET